VPRAPPVRSIPRSLTEILLMWIETPPWQPLPGSAGHHQPGRQRTRYRDRAPKAWQTTENTLVAGHFSETPKSVSPGNSAQIQGSGKERSFDSVKPGNPWPSLALEGELYSLYDGSMRSSLRSRAGHSNLAGSWRPPPVGRMPNAALTTSSRIGWNAAPDCWKASCIAQARSMR
jgi:hypothetical protein